MNSVASRSSRRVFPDARGIAHVLPQDADGPKASLAEAGDCDLVLSLWVDHDAVKTAIVDQVGAQNPHGVETEPAPVHRRIEEEIEAGKTDNRLFL